MQPYELLNLLTAAWQTSNPVYIPKRSQVIKNKRRRAHLQRTARK